MVYFYTSTNVKIMKDLLNDYEATCGLTEIEYTKSFLEKCPEDSDDAKIGWITSTFLGIQKHFPFLKDVASTCPGQDLEDDQIYFIILLHGMIFQIDPKDSENLYKCMFNLSKPLLNSISKLFRNSQILKYIASTAQIYCDTQYVTEQIIRPLTAWQPCMEEFATKYAGYVYKISLNKTKPLTVPRQPNVLERKPRKKSPILLEESPQPPPNSLQANKRMQPKYVIDQKIQENHEKNRAKANKLLMNVKHFEPNYAQVKSQKVNDNTEREVHTQITPCRELPQFYKKSTVTVKDTRASMRRLKHHIECEEQGEIAWLESILASERCIHLDEDLDKQRQRNERERLMEIERKHLLAQISYEEAILAKKKLLELNKKNYEDFKREKEIWQNKIDEWKLAEMENFQKQSEKLSMIELNVLQNKNNVLSDRKENANMVKAQSAMLKARALKEKQEMLEKKVKLIKELKVLSMIAKEARMAKVVDLTETGGFGFLCEMSVAELQERLSAAKMNLQDELAKKKQMIAEQKLKEQNELEETKHIVQAHFAEKSTRRAAKAKSKLGSMLASQPVTSQEILDLKKKLEEKRQLRVKLS